MLREQAIKKAKTTAKRIKDCVYILQDNNYGFRGYYTLTQQQYDNNPDLTITERDIIRGYDQFGCVC